MNDIDGIVLPTWERQDELEQRVKVLGRALEIASDELLTPRAHTDVPIGVVALDFIRRAEAEIANEKK